MSERPHVCVFCGSSIGARPAYAAAAQRLGAALARLGIGVVYGGGRVGIMGTVADATLAAGGRVVGIIPEALAEKEIAHAGVTELHVVPDMHTRKALMARLSDAFLMLPGGVGTYEEFFEIFTWGLLGIHAKPIGILDVEGYFGPLHALIDHAVAERFLRREHLELLLRSDDPEWMAANLLRHVPPPPGPKWIDLERT